MPARQGSQKVAQKSSSTTSLPRCSLRRSLLPSTVESSKSGGASCARDGALLPDGAEAVLPEQAEHRSSASSGQELRSITAFAAALAFETNNLGCSPWSPARW